jgi:suppressor of ftsI
VNIEPEGSADLIMDFTDPIIRGMSLFHCHLLKHEDKGMMAKILFQ